MTTNIAYDCPYRSDDYDHCTVTTEKGASYHKITLKRPATFNQLNIQNVHYSFDSSHEVVHVTEPLEGPIVTNLYSLDIDTPSDTITWIINAVVRFLLNLKRCHLTFKPSTVTSDAGRHFCLYVAMIVQAPNSLAVNFIERHRLIKAKTTKRSLDSTLFKKILGAFLFDRLSSKTKVQPIVCGPTCRFKKHRAKFGRFDYAPIHRILCLEDFTSDEYPGVEHLVRNER